MLEVGTRIKIPLTEFELSYARGSGPGGQNVNKVNSKAVLTWQAVGSPSLPADVRERFLAKFGNKLSENGELVIASDRFRDQRRNVDDCMEKLSAMLLTVLQPPKKRKKTKPSRGSVERRLKEKRQKSDKKAGRKWSDW